MLILINLRKKWKVVSLRKRKLMKLSWNNDMTPHDAFTRAIYFTRDDDISEKMLLRWSVSANENISMNISSHFHHVWVLPPSKKFILKSNRKFMEFLFHWVTKTIKVASGKLFAQTFFCFASLWVWNMCIGSRSWRKEP